MLVRLAMEQLKGSRPKSRSPFRIRAQARRVFCCIVDTLSPNTSGTTWETRSQYKWYPLAEVSWATGAGLWLQPPLSPALIAVWHASHSSLRGTPATHRCVARQPLIAAWHASHSSLRGTPATHRCVASRR